MQEARVLAELLFNSHYLDTLQQAHSYLSTTWYEHEANREISQAHAKVHFRLGRNVEAEAYGTSFTVGKQNYFWVSRLLPSHKWCGAKQVVYHPLGGRDITKHKSLFPDIPQPLFRDIMEGRRPTPQTLPAAELPESFRHFGQGHHYNLIAHVASSPVIKSFHWAKRITTQISPVFADNQVLAHLWSRPGHLPAGTETRLPHNLFFQQVRAYLQQLGCSTNLVEINNPGHRFGPGRSTFPYACAPNRITHLPDGRHRPLSIARVGWGGGNFYLFNVLDDKNLVLCYHKQLTKLSLKKCNDLLLAAIEANFEWEYVGRKLPYVNSYVVIVFDVKVNIEWVSESINTGLKSAVSHYNQSVEFLEQVEKLDLANVPSDYEQLKMMDEVRNNMWKTYYPGDYIGEPFSKIK